MAIIKRPGDHNKTAEDFIKGAPDASTTTSEKLNGKGFIQGNQRQVCFAMPPELLAKVDAAANRLSLTRSGYMKMVLTRAVEAE